MIDEHEITKKHMTKKHKLLKLLMKCLEKFQKVQKDYADNLLGGTENVLTDTLAKLEKI